ncbi:MAG: hypothetical protein JKY65_31185 [Planctomycetes bacterium]|nr:hypothetical protein [Planctomycetota bacterium]
MRVGSNRHGSNRHGSHRRGFAIADFLVGTAIFAGALVGFTTLSQSKFDVIHQASAEQVALSRLEFEIDKLRRVGLPGAPNPAKTDPDGFQPVRSETVKLKGLGPGTLTISARPLVSRNAANQRVLDTDLYEVRVKLVWTDGHRGLSTILPRRRK